MKVTKSMVAIAAALVAAAGFAGDSAPFFLDTMDSPRVARAVETITYSSTWAANAPAGAEAVVAVGDEPFHSEAGTGEVAWSPAGVGTFTLTHKVMSGGTQYGDTLTATFTVPVRDIARAQVVVDCSDVTYCGTAYTPAVQSVKWGDDTLAAGTDYTLAYSGNVDAGTATITLTGTNAYNGTYVTNFTIRAKKLTAAMIGNIDSVTYNNAAHTPQPTVTDAERNVTLEKDQDYTLSYTNNVAAGTAAVVVTGKGNYTGMAPKTFTIAPLDIGDATVTLGAALVYNGQVQTQAVSGVSLDGLDVTFTVSGNTATDVATYALTVTGTGNFAGTAEKSFSVARKPLTEEMVGAVGNLPYIGAAQTPEPVVTDAARGVTLGKDVDYTLSYGDNTVVGEGTVTVTGTGNYTNRIVRTFAIERSEGSELEDILGGNGQAGLDDEGGWIVKLTNDVGSADLPIDFPDNFGRLTIDLNGHDLLGANGEDGAVLDESVQPGGDGKSALRIVSKEGDGAPTVLSVITTGGDALVKGGDGGAGNPGGNGAPAIEVVDTARAGVLINVGAGVTVRGGGGGRSVEGPDGASSMGVIGEIGTNDGVILPYALTDAMVDEIDVQAFTGAAVTPEPVVYDETLGKELEEGTDYVLSWTDNVRPGTASVTVTGTGDYLGEVTRTFVIGTPVERTLRVGEYFKATLVELGYDVPTNGTPYSVVAKGLPAGLKLKYNPVQTKKGKKGKKIVVKKAKVEWWIEGVPTAALDFFTNPPYLVITAQGDTRTEPLPVEVLEQEVTDLPDLAFGQSLSEQFYLSGVTNGWTVTGLPPGLKYTAKTVTEKWKSGTKTIVVTNALPYSVYGKTTKAGLFTITAKQKVNALAARSTSGTGSLPVHYETMKYRVLVTPKASDVKLFGENLTNITTVAYVSYAWNLSTDLPAAGGKVTKVTGLPAGMTFAGQIIGGMPTKVGTYVVTFTKKVKQKVKGKTKSVAKTAQILWRVVPNDAAVSLGFNENGGVVEGGVLGLRYRDLLAFTATEGAQVTASGLPKGITLADLGGGKWGFKGYTTKAGTYLVTVTAKVNGNVVRQRLALKVEGLPQWAKGTYNGLVYATGETPVVPVNAQAARSTSGLATITVSAAGKISGKFYEGGTNWTFTAASYTERTRGSASLPGGSPSSATDTFICSNLVAKYAYKVTSKDKNGKKKTVTKYVTRTFTLTVEVAGTRDACPDRGVATLTEAGGSPSSATGIEALQNLWGRAEYAALGKRLFTSKSGKKTLSYKVFSFKGADASGAAIGLTAAEALSLKVTPNGAATATLSFDTGKTKKDPSTKKKVKVVYKATCSTVVNPTSAADAEPFEGGAWVYFAPAPGSGFGGLAGWVPLP